jgi:hypothetical protein
VLTIVTYLAGGMFVKCVHHKCIFFSHFLCIVFETKKSKWPKNTKKCSPSLAIKEMQIKITLRFCLIPSRTPTTTNVGKDERKKEPSYTAGGNVS